MKKIAGLWLLAALPLTGLTLAPTPPPAKAPSGAALAADTPKTTVAGNTFIAPAGWSVDVRGPATIVAAPEGDSWIALVDVDGKDADAALAAAWAAYKPDAKWPLKVTSEAPDRDGWSKQKGYDYQTSPNEKRTVQAGARFANGRWTVIIYDMSDPVAEKRGAQVALVFSRLLPKGYARESFTGKKANVLNEARLAELSRFVEAGMKELKVPGVAVGIVQGNKVVFADGYGLKDLGKPAKVDGDSDFMIASNTKALTTLLLAR
jgi:Beta-lactamase